MISPESSGAYYSLTLKALRPSPCDVLLSLIAYLKLWLTQLPCIRSLTLCCYVPEAFLAFRQVLPKLRPSLSSLPSNDETCHNGREEDGY